MSLSHPAVAGAVTSLPVLRQAEALPPVSGQMTLQSGELFRAGREILIQHADEYYRLRLTRKGKLILTK